MRIEKLLAGLLLALLVLCGCGSDASPVEDHTKSNSTATANTAVRTAHFPTFELSVPEGWAERGNTCRLFEGEGGFLLVCPLEDGAGAEQPLQTLCEQLLAQQLELFYNTDYYAGQVRFDYTEYETDTQGRSRVSGTLYNGKTGEELSFSGAYYSEPGCSFVYFRNGESGAAEVRALREVSYDSFRTL
ncbi:MAG: hypothetical protein IKX83_05765 [Clostridia bacterium]|nr:hypothetical protein [Clostridia bacterium]